MARPPRRRPTLDLDQAAALRRLVAVVGAGQATVTAVQPTSQPDPATSASAPGWQPMLGEAS